MIATVTSINSGLAKLLPEKLTEAREAAGLNMTELAEALGVTRQAVSRYELGTLVPSPEIMSKIAATLHQPLGFFTLARPSSNLASGTSFFRSFKSASATSRRICHRRKQWLVDTYSFLAKYINFPDVRIPEVTQESYSPEDIEEIARKCRRAWGLGDGPIGDMVQLLEASGIIVARSDFGFNNIDAFSFWHGDRPFIFLGTDKSSSVRSRFDAAHELGHMLLHAGVTREQLEDPDTLKRVEKEADQFASRFLLPITSFPNEVFSSKLNNFVELKKRWKVSIGAMIYRCSDLEILTEDQVLNLRRQMSVNKMRTREPLDDILPMENPSLLMKAAQLLLKNGLKLAEDFVKEIGLAAKTIEQLCTLPAGTLACRELPAKLTLKLT